MFQEGLMLPDRPGLNASGGEGQSPSLSGGNGLKSNILVPEVFQVDLEGLDDFFAVA